MQKILIFLSLLCCTHLSSQINSFESYIKQGFDSSYVEALSSFANGYKDLDTLKINTENYDCNLSKILAKHDINNGRYLVYLGGYLSSSSQTFERIMWFEYGVILIKTGICTPMPTFDCYSEVSKAFIIEKFGEDIFQKAYEKAKALDLAGKGDLSIYRNGTYTSISKHICQNFDKRLRTKPPFNLHFELSIKENGEVSLLEIFEKNDKEVDDELIRLIESLPKLSASIVNGKRIDTKARFQIILSKKRKNCR